MRLVSGSLVKTCERNRCSTSLGSNELVLKMALTARDRMGSSFAKHADRFPLTQLKEVIVEFYYVLRPLQFIQVRSQAMQDFILFEVYVKLIFLSTGVLDPTASLVMQDPGHRNAFVELERRSRPQWPARQSSQLDARKTEVRRILRDSMCERYHNRYNPFLA